MGGRKDTRNNDIVRYAPHVVATGYGAGKIDYVSNNVHIPLTSYPVSADLLPVAKTIRAGQAVGSVIDFFSPASTLAFNDNVSTPPANNTPDTVGYFPVLGSCQSNWLIVFTAANDSDSGFTAADAVTRLFKNSREMRGRYWNGTKWVEKTHDMDSGIRTMVVGMVDPDTNDALVANLRTTLHNAAKAGDPIPHTEPGDVDGHGPGFRSNPSASAYFATDVAQLVASLNAILTRITSGTFASGSPSVVPQGDDEDKNFVFSATYKINDYNQWAAWLTKYLVTVVKYVDSDDLKEKEKLIMTKEWEFNGDRLVPTLGSRANRVYTTPYLKGNSGTSLVQVSGISDSDMTALTGVTNHITDFKNWLIRYNNIEILGDSEHSNLQMVKSPDLAALKEDPTVNNRPSRIYIQTNRGVLHAIDYDNGGEQWAFFPPNVFQTRVKAMKFDQNIAGEPWFNGDGVNIMASDPMNILDGLLSTADVITSEGPKTILIGNMGLGGNGLYAMDVTQPSSAPTFLWAVENARYSGGPSEEVGLWGKSVGGANVSQYDKLGMTVVATTLLKTRVGGADE
jgi:type IV pilus assembly protein PilY1